MGSMAGEDALAILVEQERRRDIVDFLWDVVSLRLPNGKPALDRRDRRILAMYVSGYPQRVIAAKVSITHPGVIKRIRNIPKKILKCQGGHLVNWDKFLQPPQSILEAHVPEEMLRWNFDSSMESYNGSYWGKTKDKRVWKTRTHCVVPEYFQGCFGRTDVRCTYCGIQCKRTRS